MHFYATALRPVTYDLFPRRVTPRGTLFHEAKERLSFRLCLWRDAAAVG